MEEPLISTNTTIIQEIQEPPVSWWPFSWFKAPKVAQRRLVDRTAQFHQSNGKLQIRKRIRIKDRRALYAEDWFHSLVNSPTPRLICILLSCYMGITCVFAVFYYLIGRVYSCNMGIGNFREAFTFSLETIATIGFGTQDIFFDDCILPIIVLALQICTKLVADALTIGILYSRIARPMTRANTILFANMAIIRRIRGRLYLMFQVCELRKHQLLEAHIRLYLMRHEREPEVGGEVSYFQACSMRLTHPNDELGAMLLLCLPQVVVHEIDLWSPLYPPPLWADKERLHKWTPPTHQNILDIGASPIRVASPQISKPIRQFSPNGSTQGYQTLDEEELLLGTEVFPSVHKRSSTEISSPYVGRYRTFSGPNPSFLPTSSSLTQDPYAEEKEMIKKYMQDRKIEIVAIVEGTDAATGGSVQARHSYTYDELLWDCCYERCVFEDPDGAAVIDFSKFHDTIPVGEDSDFSGIMSSHV